MSFVNPEDDPGWKYLRVSQEQALKDSMKAYDSKKNVWIPDEEEGYLPAEIKGTKGDQVTVVNAKGLEANLKKELCQEMNPPKFERTEDMSNLTFLNDASVLHNLRSRYEIMMIYTYSGLFCVVINPYKRLPIYTESVVKMFMGKRRTEMPPHLFAVSDEAYRNMMQDKENQSMLITGESGAGKTENTKKVLSFFAVVGATQTQQAAAVHKKPGEKEPEKKKGKDAKPEKKPPTLEDQIVMTNPVLESFGNARTVRNNNSSRFGKFIRVHFNGKGRMAGGDIDHYLLEKSRVIKQNPGERCYHIFYQIMSGQNPDLCDELLLDQDIRFYHFCSQAEVTVDGMDDKEEFKNTDEAFDVLGFTKQEKGDIYKLVSAIMHMGEMKFKQRPREEQAETDGTDEAERACAMYGLDTDEFLKALTKPRVKVGNEWVNKGQNLEQVTWGVGAMAKGIYARMFSWLVARCNRTLDVAATDRKFWIGVLDIAGFEIFDHNSFEQQWINFVNEKLQQFFNHHMFVLEQEEYQREGIHWEFIDFGLDLQTCIELIEKPLGVISMLDEECIVPKATDLTYVQKMNDQHLGKHPNFEKPKPPKGKQSEAHYAVRHYAGTVRYNVTGWLEKNKDPLNDSVVSVMKKSKENQLLLDIWESYVTQEENAAAMKGGGESKKKGKSGSFMTVSMMYRESLNKLMNMLHETHPHFVRCIIPNEQKKSGLLDAALVMNQLTCNGVLEGIRICRKGFPNRMLHADFVQRYTILAADEAKSSPDPIKASDAIMVRLEKENAITAEQFRIGTTKVFFKAGVLAHLEDLRDAKLSLIMKAFQSKIRFNLAQIDKRKRREQHAATMVVERSIRNWLELRVWTWFKLLGQVKPLLKQGKVQEEMDKLTEKLKTMEENHEKEDRLRKELEEQNAKLLKEKEELMLQLSSEKNSMSEVIERTDSLNKAKAELEAQVADLNKKISDQEDANSDLNKLKKKAEAECDAIRKQIAELELALRKSQSETATRDHQIKSLQDEMTMQDELIAKLNKEKKLHEDTNRKVTEDLQSEEDKVNHLNKIKAKLEQNIDELEDSLEREKRLRQDTEKAKRKTEGDLKVAQENIEELNKQKHDVENNLRKKEQELNSLNGRLEDEQLLIAKLQKQIKELQAKIEELEEELNGEQQARSKAEKGKTDISRELEELSERLDEAGGSTQAQMELNKKREAELSRLRRDLDDANLNHESQLTGLRKKHNDAVAEMGDQLDQLQKQKAKNDKDRGAMQREIEELHNAIDAEQKAKANAEKASQAVEIQIEETKAKVDEQTRQLSDLVSIKSRMANENADLLRQFEESENQVGSLNRLKQQLQASAEEVRHAADDEARDRQSLAGQMRNLQHESETLRVQLDEEAEAKNEVARQLSKANAEAQQWHAKFESEGMAKAEELEEAKRKIGVKVTEIQEQLEQTNAKILSVEKARQRLLGELDDAQVDIERANALASQLEKKQKGFDKVVEEWKHKCDDIHAELDASQRENRNLSTEVLRMKSVNDELIEQTEGIRRENKNLTQEIKDLSDQLTEGGRSVHELQKMVRRLELEKEELQTALDEAESSLEAEEGKVLRSQLEVTQIRSEIEKRLREKEEEFENTRKNHQRALDSMQASLEGEAKGRAELLRIKKKLEGDINELEIALDHANKANADAQKNIKRYLEQIKEIQSQLEDEQRHRDELRDQYAAYEKRAGILQSEKEEVMGALEGAERARKQAELDLVDTRDQLHELNGQNATLIGVKRKLEGEIQALNADLQESINELKGSEERGKKAMIDAARLADELRQEQEHAGNIERFTKGLELQMKEMQARLEEAEAAALKGGKKIIAKLEQRVREVETELEAETRRHTETQKNLSKQDRQLKELQFQLEEDKKNHERLTDLVEKLQQKIKTYKRQVEEAEELASTNLAKYRQMQLQFDDCNERAEMAENSLAKMRAKNRSSASMAPGGLRTSASSAAVLRSPSRARANAYD